ELDGVFDGENVARAGVIDVVDHRGERRRFTRAGGTCDQNEPSSPLAQLADDVRATERRERRYFRGDDSEYCAEAVDLVEIVGGKSRLVAKGIREIEIEVLEDLPALLWGHDFQEQLLHLGRFERLLAERDKIAACADERRVSDSEVQVAPAA